jgi:predicted nucleic acid-binding protein
MEYILDTNTILRYLLKDNLDQYQEINDIFIKIKSGKYKAILLESVFIESIFVLTSFYKIPKADIIKNLTQVILYRGIECDKNLFIESMNISCKSNIHIVDAILLITSKRLNKKLITFDQKLIELAK